MKEKRELFDADPNQILDKTDLSKVDKGGVKVSKVEHYGWSDPGEMGVFMMIPKTKLNIDKRYQREIENENKIVDIAKSFKWSRLGTISVARRPDGTFWIFDGGHRARASFRRDDIKALPCMIYAYETLSEEALDFIGMNTTKTAVSAYSKHRAGSCSGDVVVSLIEEILARHGLTLIRGGSTSPTHISCVHALNKCCKEDSESLDKVLGLCIKLSKDGMVSGKCLTAMFSLQKHFKEQNIDVVEKFGEKLVALESQKSLEAKMNQFCARAGKTGAQTCAQAVVEICNHKIHAKHRLVW